MTVLRHGFSSMQAVNWKRPGRRLALAEAKRKGTVTSGSTIRTAQQPRVWAFGATHESLSFGGTVPYLHKTVYPTFDARGEKRNALIAKIL